MARLLDSLPPDFDTVVDTLRALGPDQARIQSDLAKLKDKQDLLIKPLKRLCVLGTYTQEKDVLYAKETGNGVLPLRR